MRSTLLAGVIVSAVMRTAFGSPSILPTVQYTIRDSDPEDGVGDHIRPSSDSGYIGQVTGPGPASFEEETFLEYDISGNVAQELAQLHLAFFYSDIDNGTGKSVSISTYIATGSPFRATPTEPKSRIEFAPFPSSDRST